MSSLEPISRLKAEIQRETKSPGNVDSAKTNKIIQRIKEATKEIERLEVAVSQKQLTQAKSEIDNIKQVTKAIPSILPPLNALIIAIEKKSKYKIEGKGEAGLGGRGR